MAGPGPAPRWPTDHARRRRSWSPGTSGSLAVGSGGFGWRRYLDPAYPIDRTSPGSGDPKVATRDRLNPSKSVRSLPLRQSWLCFAGSRHSFAARRRSDSSDGCHPLHRADGGFVRAVRALAPNFVGSFASSPRSSADLIGFVSKNSPPQRSRWVCFATTAGAPSAAVDRRFGRF
jgi:hypothetical protein